MRIVEITRTSKLLRQVESLADQNRSTLGFLPPGAFSDYASHGHIIALFDIDKIVGYVMYRYKGTTIIIVHFCIAQEFRSRNYSVYLLKALEGKEKDHYSDIQLYCRRDYGLRAFWTSLGFAPLSEKNGRATTRQTTLTLWSKHNPDYICLFDNGTTKAKDTILAVLDTNIVIELCDGCNDDTQLLFCAYLNHYITWYVTKDYFSEIDVNDNPDKRNAHRQFANSQCNVIECYDDEQIEFIRNKLLSIKPASKYSSKWYDLTHIATAIAFGATLFVTNDKEWINNNFSENVLSEYGLSILNPVTAVKYIDEVNTPNAYSPRSLAGLELSYSEMSSDDIPKIIGALHGKYITQKKKDLERVLNSWLSSPTSRRNIYIKSNTTPVCLILYEIHESSAVIHHILIDSKQIKQSFQKTFYKRIVFMQLDVMTKCGVNYITAIKEGLSSDLIEALKECGFFEKENLYRFTINKVLKYSEIPSRIINTDWFRKIIVFDEFSLQKYTRSTTHSVQLEKALWPLKIADSDIPCYIVPIQANYAKDLFDENLVNTNISLFSSEKQEASLSPENVYFKEKKHSITKFPARILWYVSYDRTMFGTKAIRACSYLDSVETSTIKRLYTKYRRLGVLNWNDMTKFGNAEDTISAYHFSYTELFDSEVPLHIIRNIIGKQTETFQSYSTITSSQFIKIYNLGRCGGTQ